VIPIRPRDYLSTTWMVQLTPGGRNRPLWEPLLYTEIWALFVTSVELCLWHPSAATNGAALISFISHLITSPIAPIKSFWIMFEKPENTVDVSKCLANLSSFAARVCKVPHSCHEKRRSNSHRYHEMLITLWLGNNLH